MYLHLGQDVVVRDGEIVGIFDLEKASVSKRTREFLSNATKQGMVVTVSYEMPKSFVVTHHDGATTVYISQISAATLKKRAGGAVHGDVCKPFAGGASEVKKERQPRQN